MEPTAPQHPILYAFDRMVENPLPVKWPLPTGMKRQFHVTTPYYQQVLQILDDELVRPVAPTDGMRYKGCPIAIDDGISGISLSPRLNPWPARWSQPLGGR